MSAGNMRSAIVSVATRTRDGYRSHNATSVTAPNAKQLRRSNKSDGLTYQMYRSSKTSNKTDIDATPSASSKIFAI